MALKKNRVILISGANRGIGYNIAKHLLKKGYNLSLGTRNLENIKKDDYRLDRLSIDE